MGGEGFPCCPLMVSLGKAGGYGEKTERKAICTGSAGQRTSPTGDADGTAAGNCGVCAAYLAALWTDDSGI